MIYGYARVSTKGQAAYGNGLEEQHNELLKAGCQEIYSDAYTGTKTDRPEFSKLLARLSDGDTLVVTKLDRIARSAGAGSMLVQDLLDRGVAVHILNMGLINNTPTGRLTLNIFFAFAEFERDMIVQRTSEGKAIARQKPGYKEGRPAADKEAIQKIAEKIKKGEMSVSQGCRELNISRSTYYKYVV